MAVDDPCTRVVGLESNCEVSFAVSATLWKHGDVATGRIVEVEFGGRCLWVPLFSALCEDGEVVTLGMLVGDSYS